MSTRLKARNKAKREGSLDDRIKKLEAIERDWIRKLKLAITKLDVTRSEIRKCERVKSEALEKEMERLKNLQSEFGKYKGRKLHV